MKQSKFVVTLASLRKHRACYGGYNRVICMLQGKTFSEKYMGRQSYIHYQHKGDISLVDIANNNGLEDALWALRCVPGANRDCRLFAVWCARQVQNKMSPKSINLLNAAEDYANSKISLKQLEDAVWDAAWDAARDAAWDAAWGTARAAARYAARDAAWDAARAAARDAERYVAWAAAWDTERSKQKEMFIKMCNGQAPWQKEQQCIPS